MFGQPSRKERKEALKEYIRLNDYFGGIEAGDIVEHGMAAIGHRGWKIDRRTDIEKRQDFESTSEQIRCCEEIVLGVVADDETWQLKEDKRWAEYQAIETRNEALIQIFGRTALEKISNRQLKI